MFLTCRATPFSWGFGERGRFDTQLTFGAASLYWAAPLPTRGRLRVTGGVREGSTETVPADFPRTPGTVRRIRVESRRFREVRPGSRCWVYADSTASYRDVDTTPAAFAPPAFHGHHRVGETGVLVDVDVDDRAVSPAAR